MGAVISRRFVPLFIALVLVLGACAGDETPTAGTQADATDAADDGSSEPRKKDKDAQEDDGGASKDDSRDETDTAGGETEGDNGSEGEEAAEDDGSSRYAPSPGLYTYAQQGFEEFCDATACEREELPPRQNVKTYYEGAEGDALVVVTAARTSDNRLTKTTTLHSPQRALITKVQVRLNYEGFSFNNTYQPEPPVEAMRYPLRNGDRWNGSWEDSTSGDYRIEVGEKGTVDVGGRTVQAFAVKTLTTFRGEIEGRAEVTTWIDPATASVVKTDGRVELKSVFGRYNSTFTTTLSDGPDYR